MTPAEGDPRTTALHSDPEGAKLGMWLFLFTEMLLFGGLFLLYSVYRARYAADFVLAGGELNHFLGILNTGILLTSSFTMACAITALRRGNKRLAMILLAITLLLAGWFLVDKYVEWAVKIRHGLYPNGPGLAGRAPGQVIFFGLYYASTGLHGLHVLAGMIAIAATLALTALDRVTGDRCVLIENVGLYWHLVDVIWIFILPLYYLAV